MRVDREQVLKQVRSIIKSDLRECSCTRGSFIYGCKHTVRRLRKLLNIKYPWDVDK